MRTALLMLACSDYEATELALACHAAYLPDDVPFFILQNCRGTYDSERTLMAVETVRTATSHGQQAFAQVELAVDEADQWVGTMASTAATGNTLASQITAKLDSLSSGTQSFATAMHDVAAASEEQSASTEEIAAAANALVTAADKVRIAARLFGAT